MSDITTTNLDDLLYNLRGPLQKNYRKRHVLHAELKRVAANESFDGGDEVRIPVILAPMQGGGNPGQSGTINVPHNFKSAKALFNLQNIVQPIGLTLDAEEDSLDNSAASAVALAVEEARNGIAEIENDQFNAPGALLATITGGSSPGLTPSVSATATAWPRLYPNRVVDVLTRATGADAGQGKRRLIDSVDRVNGTVTFLTTQQASDGGSGNITFSSSSGIYIAGVYTTAGNNAMYSIHDIASTTGTFESIDRAAVQGWQAIDGREGDTTAKVLSDSMLDDAVIVGGEGGEEIWSFGVAEHKVIARYKGTKYALTQVNPKMKMLSGGFAGIEYVHANGTIGLVGEYRFEPGKLVLVPGEDLALYHGRRHAGGPDFVTDSGSRKMRFSRALPYEMWLRNKLQLAAKRCNRVVFLDDLTS